MLSRSKAPVQNRLPDLTVDLATEVSSTNKTDVKSHNPGPSSFAMDRQPSTKVNVPSYRFSDVEMATESSSNVKLIRWPCSLPGMRRMSRTRDLRSMRDYGTTGQGAKRAFQTSSDVT